MDPSDDTGCSFSQKPLEEKRDALQVGEQLSKAGCVEFARPV